MDIVPLVRLRQLVDEETNVLLDHWEEQGIRELEFDYLAILYAKQVHGTYRGLCGSCSHTLSELFESVLPNHVFYAHYIKQLQAIIHKAIIDDLSKQSPCIS